jgi:transcriptional regulator with XRE-family HTH domain
MTLGETLRHARKRKGLSLVSVSERSFVARETLSKIERGLSEPKIGDLKALCLALDLDLHEMVELDLN